MFRHLAQIAMLPRPCLATLAGSRDHTIPADGRLIWVLAVMIYDHSRANLKECSISSSRDVAGTLG